MDTPSLPLPASPSPSHAVSTEVHPRTRRALQMLLVGLAVGFLARWLLVAPPGLGIALATALLVSAFFLLARHQGVRLEGEGRFFALPALFFVAMVVWRDAPLLAFLNIVATLFSLVLVFVRSRQGRVLAAPLSQYGRDLLGAVRSALVGLPQVVLGDIGWKERGEQGHFQRGYAAARGIVLALPLLLLFGALFSAADPIFDREVAYWVRLWFSDLVPTLFLTLLWGWLTVGMLRRAFLEEAPQGEVGVKRGFSLSLGNLEIRIILSALNLLFLLFVAFQFRYLFGGHALVETTLGMSYADYARAGFFELVAVAALALPLLLGLDALHRGEGERAQRSFRLFSGGLIALLMVVVLSALERMRLYTSVYGLTEGRLFATVFILWLATVILWLGATVLRGRGERFAGGAILAGFLFLAGLNLLNPDALIVRQNLALAERTGRWDGVYVAGRSADAYPALRQALHRLPAAESCVLALSLNEARERRQRWEVSSAEEMGTPRWATWNWSRARAQEPVALPSACAAS